eukprot:3730020-Pyramimonas_sp.AAC.1
MMRIYPPPDMKGSPFPDCNVQKIQPHRPSELRGRTIPGMPRSSPSSSTENRPHPCIRFNYTQPYEAKACGNLSTT